jgi:hypothetical protein
MENEQGRNMQTFVLQAPFHHLIAARIDWTRIHDVRMNINSVRLIIAPVPLVIVPVSRVSVMNRRSFISEVSSWMGVSIPLIMMIGIGWP